MSYTYEIAKGRGGVKIERVFRPPEGDYESEEFYFSNWADASQWLIVECSEGRI